ncbi:MAG TPA: CRTAC1 family protein [Candidatus Latescibacteria bacterium]|jgi:hypothetical protein|nr:hypothetical protein [Gemmatimonadaceae bacterium]MDP6014525.1 CRTAC1 family protein [Candidatus Latescibacterota bacterium]HJP31454.1 CRTAC1 family protein [Candidatus Latescibacterota bacterium]
MTALILWLTAAAPSGAQPETTTTVVYTEVARQQGLDFTHTHGGSGTLFYVETVGSGGGFIDHDSDGDLDIYLINGSPLPGTPPGPAPVNKLFRNSSGHFEDVTTITGIGDTSYGMGLAVADYDNDGDSDLYVTNFGVNRLFRNESGVFHEATSAAGVGDSLWGTSAAWLDYDNDGQLDLYVTNYIDWHLSDHEDCFDRGHLVYCDPGRYDAVVDRLYHNDGEGRFAEVADLALGSPPPLGKGLGVATADIDSDGDLEIYVANDETPNHLYINEGGSYRESALIAGVSHNGGGEVEAGMGVDFSDFDGDGRADLFVTNFSYETYTLYRGLEQGFFQDVTAGAGLVSASLLPLGFGTRFIDFDNDGDVDIYCANGHVMHNIGDIERSLSYAMANQLLRNDAGLFVDISARAGEDTRQQGVSRGLASADYDDDGDIDLLVTNNNGPVSLLRNDGGNHNHWLSIRLHGEAANRDGIGTRVELWSAGRRMVRERSSGGSYLASHDPRVHFGLGSEGVDSLRVHWPGGGSTVVRTPSSDQTLLVRQP